MNKFSSCLFIFILFLVGCSSQLPNNVNSISSNNVPIAKNIKQRNAQLKHLLHWTVQGKIAFIQKNKKSRSASLYWKFEKNAHDSYNQQIDLTSLFGISILHVKTTNNQHLIKIKGKTYQGDNLNQMIYNLTGLVLPTQALTSWLKGVKYYTQDKITYINNSPLPSSLIANKYYQNWVINYSDYKIFNGYQLATKFIIRHDNLLIKIALNKWSVL